MRVGNTFSTMKAFLSILGGIFAVILVIAVVFAAIFIPKALKLDHEATAYIQDTVPKIVAKWNSHELIDRATPDLLSATKSGTEIDRIFNMFRELGTLSHIDTPTGTVGSHVLSREKGVVTVGNYKVHADFEKGPATISIQLKREDGGWKINGFHIDSEVFLPRQ